AVRPREVPALQEGDPQRLQVLRRDRPPAREHRLGVRVAALDPERSGPPSATHREVRNEARGDHARQGAESLQERVLETDDRVVPVVPFGRERPLRGEDARSLEPRIRGKEPDEAPDQEQSGEEERRREGDVATQQQPRDTALPPASRDCGAGLPEAAGQGPTDRAPRGHDPDRDRRHDRQRERERYDAPIHPEPLPPEHGAGDRGRERQPPPLDRGVRDDEAEDARGEGEERTLPEELADDPPASGAQCGTDRDLLAPLDRSREEEPRGIDRCDQEQRQGRTLEEEEGEHVFPGGSAGERVDREPAHPLLRGRSPSSPAWIAVSMARASSAGTPGRSRPITLRWRGAVCSVALPTVLPVGLLGVPSLALPVAPPATLPVAPPAAPPSCSLSGSLPHPL